MRKTLMALSLATSCYLLLPSCKKDDAASIVGKWTLSEYGADANSNGKVDAGETAASTDFHISIDFNSDKSFTSVYSDDTSSDTSTGTYNYTNNTLTTTVDGDTDSVPVLSLTNSKLVLKEGSGSSSLFYVFTR